AAALGAALAPAGEGLAAADRDDVLGRHRVAAVGEVRQGALAVAAAAEDRDDGNAGNRGRRAGVVDLARRADRKDLGRAPRRHQRRRRVADRPVLPAAGERLDLVTQLLADEDVELVALADLGRPARRQGVAVADDDVDERFARKAEFADEVAGGCRPGAQ